MIANINDLDNTWTLDKKHLRVLSSTPASYLNTISADFQYMSFPSDRMHHTQGKLFLSFRDKKSMKLEKPG